MPPKHKLQDDAARGDADAGESKGPLSKRLKASPQEMHVDIKALVERMCDLEMLKKYVESSKFDERQQLEMEKLTVFAIKQSLTWLRAIEQELLKISPSQESLAQLSKSCFKALGFSGPGAETIDTLEKMKNKVLTLEALVDIENVHGRLVRIAAGGGPKKKAESSDDEDDDEKDAAALMAADALAQKKKRPTTPFFRFLADRRESLNIELRKELATESIKPTLVVKRGSEIWKALAEADRAPYEDPFKAEKEVYDRERAAKKAKEEAEQWEADPLSQRQYRMLGCHLTRISHGSPVWCMIAESVLGTQPEAVAPDANFISVDRMFSISRASEEKHYAKSAQTPNRRLLWYGGPLASWAGVLSNGLRLPQPETPFGAYSFGKGIYFSDMVDAAAAKSGAGDGESAIVLLCEVALGKSVEKSQADVRSSTKFPPGHQSTIGRGLKAPKGTRALPDGALLTLGPVEEQQPQPGKAPSWPHNDYVVYNTAHVRMRYLLEVRLLSGSHQEDISKARAEIRSLTDVASTSQLSAKRLSRKTSADQTLLAK